MAARVPPRAAAPGPGRGKSPPVGGASARQPPSGANRAGSHSRSQRRHRAPDGASAGGGGLHGGRPPRFCK
eukprot:11157734-Lingulodinium_polyedra.AAC.1